MVRPRWANMYAVKHGLPSVCQNSPSTMLAIIWLSRKTVYFCYCLWHVQDTSKLLRSKQKAPNFWSPAPSNCVSLQKYSVFSTMQGCIVPLKSNKLMTCVWNVAKTCVLDSFKTVNCFYPSSAFLSIWNRFRPVLQGEPLEQVRIPTALPAVPFVHPSDWLEGWFCVYTSKTVIPLSRLLSVVFCMIAVPYYTIRVCTSFRSGNDRLLFDDLPGNFPAPSDRASLQAFRLSGSYIIPQVAT